METKIFNSLVREKNKKYLEMFGYIPCITDYSCNRESYLEALDKAITINKELKFILAAYGKDIIGSEI